MARKGSALALVGAPQVDDYAIGIRGVSNVRFDLTLFALQADVTASLGGKLDAANVNTPFGVAGLGGDGKILPNLLPAFVINDTFPVASQAEMLGLAAGKGDVAVRTDAEESGGQRSYILKQTPANTLANWVELKAPGSGVLSVAGQTGAVILGVGDISDMTVFGRTLARATDNAAGRAALGLGSAATQPASAFAPNNHSHTFLSLTDTPDSFAGLGGKFIAVKADGSGLEFVPAGGGGTLGGLTDVNATGAVTGSVLKYNAVTAKWEAGADLVGTGGAGAQLRLRDQIRVKTDCYFGAVITAGNTTYQGDAGATVAGTGAKWTPLLGEPNTSGAMMFGSGTTTSAVGRIWGLGAVNLTAGPIIFDARYKLLTLGDVGNGLEASIGLLTAGATAGLASIGIHVGYRQNSNGGRWFIRRTPGSGGAVDTDLGFAPVAGQYYDVRMVINAAGTSLQVFIDDMVTPKATVVLTPSDWVTNLCFLPVFYTSRFVGTVDVNICTLDYLEATQDMTR